MFPGLKICEKCVCARASAPDPAGIAYSAPPDLLAGLEEGREGSGRGKGMGEKGGAEGDGRERKREKGDGERTQSVPTLLILEINHCV